MAPTARHEVAVPQWTVSVFPSLLAGGRDHTHMHQQHAFLLEKREGSFVSLLHIITAGAFTLPFARWARASLPFTAVMRSHSLCPSNTRGVKYLNPRVTHARPSTSSHLCLCQTFLQAGARTVCRVRRAPSTGTSQAPAPCGGAWGAARCWACLAEGAGALGGPGERHGGCKHRRVLGW